MIEGHDDGNHSYKFEREKSLRELVCLRRVCRKHIGKRVTISVYERGGKEESVSGAIESIKPGEFYIVMMENAEVRPGRGQLLRFDYHPISMARIEVIEYIEHLCYGGCGQVIEAGIIFCDVCSQLKAPP